MTTELPSGTVTLVFTDIEGSTTLLQELGPERYAEVLSAHRSTLRTVFAACRGFEVDTQGDAFFYAFESARAALRAASDAQRALAEGPVRIRIGIHSGEPLRGGEGYVGIDVHRSARIMAAGHGGQILVSETTRRLAGDDLELLDLGLQRLKDMTAPERIYQLGAGEFPPLRTLNQTNLPVASNPLLGRGRELVELTTLFEDGAQMVTITGPGGTGKTRLALQVAAELVERFADGVFWVPLAGLGDPELVLPSVSHELGTRDDLVPYLRGRETLVLLDNFEHLLEAAESLGGLIAAAPGLRLLVTSRSPLHLDAEQEYPLDPLPDEGAAELFVERARQAGSKLETSATVHEICRRVDNLPLAVELAAGRVKLLGPDTLLTRLDERLPLLTGGRRDLPERQRTLRATIEWSYDLLGDEAKHLFAGLAVFAGRFPLDAAEEICAADLDLLADLVELSLVKPVDEGWFLMLETLREYAAEELDAREDAAELRERHAEWFLAMAEEAEDRMYAHGQAELFDRLDRAHDNLRTALDWFRSVRATALELRLAAALQDFWIEGRHGSEGRARLESALAERNLVSPAVRGKALDGAAWLAVTQGDYEAGDRYASESLALARSLGDGRRIVTALSSLGVVELYRGNYDRTRELFDEALAHAQAAGDEVWIRILLGQLGDLALNEGAYDDADRYNRECLERAEAAGDLWTRTVALTNLGFAHRGRGESGAAATDVARGLELALELGSPLALWIAFEAVAALAAASDPGGSARLVGIAQAMRNESGTLLPPFEARVHRETMEVLEGRLEPEELERLLADGRGLEPEEAGVLALELVRGTAESASLPT